ncbi:NAD(P)/FAD-dependent oxidoreductase [Paenibacillus sp. GCM10012307]
MKELIRRERIDCDFQEQDAYLYTTSGNMTSKLEQEFRAYEKLGIPGSYVDRVPLDSLGVRAAVVMPDQAQFHPLRYLRYLLGEFAALGGQIYEQTEATSVESGDRPQVLTKEGHLVTARYVVAATHYPFHEGIGLYFARMHPERSYVIACPLLDEQQDYAGGMYLNIDEPKRSVRSVQISGKNALLIGGESHQTGQGICTHRHYEAIQQFAQHTFGLNHIAYRWSAQDLISLDKLPYIGPVTAGNSRVLIATGYRKWGHSCR